MVRHLPTLSVERAYNLRDRNGGYRVLVDRLWPRGLTKQELQIDVWAKDLAPSTELRKWFGHRPERWSEFKRRYRNELRSRPIEVDSLLKIAARRRVVLLYGARDEEHNHARVLRQFLESRRAARKRQK